MPAAPDRVADASEGWGFALKSFALFPQTAPPLLGVGWTLIHEMWFYLVFALVICLPRRVLRPALVLWAAITVAGYLVFQPSQASAPVLAVMLNPLTLEFIAGAFAAWVLQNMGMPSHKVCVVIIGFSILWVVTAMALDIKVPDWAQHASRTAVYCLPLTLIVWASSVWQPRVPVWLRALGDMSYSLYLTHYLVLITLARIMRMIAPESTAVVPIQTGLTLLALGLSLAVGWLTFRLIERPLGRRLGRKPQSVVKA